MQGRDRDLALHMGNVKEGMGQRPGKMLLQRVRHLHQCLLMGVVHQMGVNFAGGGGGGVAQGLADVKEGHPLEGGHGGKGVA